MAWKFVVTDQAGTSVGEPRATGRTLNLAVSATATASFTIRDTDPMWDQIATETSNLKIYNDAGTLVFYGPIVSDQETASGQGATVQYTAADQSWILGKRFTGKDLTGVGTTYTSTDPGSIITSILAALNAEQATGLTIGTVGTFTLAAATVTYLWKKAADALNELGATEGSYEWSVSYIDGATGSVPTCHLNLVSELGSDASAAVFLEYGAGTKHNCSSYTRTTTQDNHATRVWAVGNGSTAVAEADDTSYETFQRYEDVVSFSDITDLSLLGTLAAAHVAVRKTPQVLVNMTPFPALAPKYGVDWQIGDRVSARVVTNNTVRVSGIARIWGAQIQIDEIGNESATLTLQPS